MVDFSTTTSPTFYSGIATGQSTTSPNTLLPIANTGSNTLPSFAATGGALPTTSSIPLGGQNTAANSTTSSNNNSTTSPNSNSNASNTPTVVEYRAIIYDQTGLFATTSPLMTPLADIGGVIFPYTPTIAVSHRANYEIEQLVHTNYGTPYYTNSTVDNISINALFTCQSPDEAAYIDAMKHFFKTCTKMFYGQSTSNLGMPPPILFLDAHGQMAFDNIPILVKDFDYSYIAEVDYISSAGNKWGLPETRVPVTFNVVLNLIPAYSRNAISTKFGLNQYASGSLLTVTGSNTGGWI